jgi:YesN/AraC family two-component response regulator
MYKVLIVDDEIDMVETLEMEVELLFPANVSIDLAYSGLESLDFAQRTKYDLVITDFRMPKMNGVEFVTAMKSSESSLNINTPVIFISAFIPDVKDIYQLQENTIFVDKPYDPESFRRNLKMLIASNRS